MSEVSRRAVVRTGVGALTAVVGGGVLGGCTSSSPSTSNLGEPAAAASSPMPTGPPAPWLDAKLAAGGGHCFAQIGRSIVAPA
jgi:hypothetical protein